MNKYASKYEVLEGEVNENMIGRRVSFLKTQANKTESKRSKKRHLLELRELDRASYISANDSKVAELAKLCIEYIRENPGVHREKIIGEIDLRYDQTGQKTQMRRTYDVLNILQMAEILRMSDDKRYEYDPYVLEGAQAAKVHDWKAQFSLEEKQVGKQLHRV